jgi:hypothetical protein
MGFSRRTRGAVSLLPTVHPPLGRFARGPGVPNRFGRAAALAGALAAASMGAAWAGEPAPEAAVADLLAEAERALVDGALDRAVALVERARSAGPEDSRWARVDAEVRSACGQAPERASAEFWGSTGVVALALALVLLASTASRELLRPSRAVAALGLGFAAASALAIAADPLLGRLVAVAGLTLGLLAVAAEGAVRRSALPMRMRVFAATIALSGALGLVLAGAARLPLAFWIYAVSR